MKRGLPVVDLDPFDHQPFAAYWSKWVDETRAAIEGRAKTDDNRVHMVNGASPIKTHEDMGWTLWLAATAAGYKHTHREGTIDRERSRKKVDFAVLAAPRVPALIVECKPKLPPKCANEVAQVSEYGRIFGCSDLWLVALSVAPGAAAFAAARGVSVCTVDALVDILLNQEVDAPLLDGLGPIRSRKAAA